MADINEADWNAVAQERNAPPETPKVPPETPPASETPPAETTPEMAPPPAEEPPKAEEVVDPYAGLHPEIRAKLDKFDQLAAALPNLINEVRATTGRVGSLQSEWAKVKASKTAEQPTQRQIAAAAKDPEEWDALKKDFPEWGDAISKFVDSRLSSLAVPEASGISQEQIEQLVAQRTEAATSELVKKLNESLVTIKHPGWKKDVNTPEFAAWYQVQKPEVQALASSTDGFDAIRMMDLYAEHKAKPAAAVRQDRQQKLAAAATTSRPGSAAVVTKSFEDMTPQEKWDYLAAQRDKAA